MKIRSEYGKILLRVSMALVFIWFGINQIYSPLSWVSYVPNLMTSMFSAGTIVLMNGCLEIILGIMLLSGLYVRFTSLILGLHLIGIAFSVQFIR